MSHELDLLDVIRVGGRDLDHCFVGAVLHVVIPDAGVVGAGDEVALVLRERKRVHSVLPEAVGSQDVLVLQLK